MIKRDSVHYVSGIRPTGRIHLGNYLGAIKKWKELSATAANCTWFVADLHGDDNAEETLAQLSNIGINAVRESGFAENILTIAHRISRYVGVGRLERMTQYKDKCETEQATLSLLAYPVLMAADIFAFGGTHIPVGNDQVQHIEFARDVVDILAAKGIHYPKPKAVFSEYPRIMSLTDGTKKMSKSDGDEAGVIYVDDAPNMIREKISRAKTAHDMNYETPEMNNLRAIYKAVGGVQIHTRFVDFKDELAEMIINELG